MKRRNDAPEHIFQLLPRFSHSPLLPLVLVLALATSCSRPSHSRLELVEPHNAPVFFDDLDRSSLKTATQQSLNALTKKKDMETLAFGEQQISLAHVRASLAAFLALLENEVDLSAPRLAQEFHIYRVTTPVLFTGYYEPLLNGSLIRTERYRYPLYRRPDDLIEVDLAAFLPEGVGNKLYGRVVNGKLVPYFSRAEIDGQGVFEGKHYELVWVDDAVARFFLHIQGSGQIQLPDGTRLRLGYAATNGKSYTSIGKVLLEQGKLLPGHTSAPAIHRYLYAHPAEQETIFFHNPRYIFFQPVPDGPRGSLGVPLTAGRSLATDPQFYPAGALAFIHTKRPIVDQEERITWHEFSRFVLLQDSGAAITGWNRADLFWGDGTGIEPGYMAHEGDLYLLLKKF